MYRPEEAYKIRITDNPESSDFSVWFDREPDELTTFLFQAMGLAPTKKNKSEFKAEGEKERAFALLMQESLALGEYPKKIPYSPSKITGEAGIEALEFSIASFKYKDAFGKKHKQDVLIYERYITKRIGFAGILARTLFNVGKEGFTVSHRPNKTKAYQLSLGGFVQTKIQEPFGFYEPHKSYPIILPEAKEKNAKERTSEEKNVSDLSDSKVSVEVTQLTDVSPEEVTHAKDVTHEEVPHAMRVTPIPETTDSIGLESEVTHIKHVTPHDVTHDEDAIPHQVTHNKLNMDMVVNPDHTKDVLSQEKNVSSEEKEDMKQREIYMLLSKLIPDLKSAINKGITFGESLSEFSIYNKLIFKTQSKVKNDLLDVSLELVPQDEAKTKSIELFIKLNLKEKQGHLIKWEVKQTKAKNHIFIEPGENELISKITSLLEEGHLFALMEEEILEPDSEENEVKEGLAPLKRIFLKEGQEYTGNEDLESFDSWEEANEKLSQIKYESKSQHYIFYIIEWENGEKIGASFELFSEDFHPEFEEDVLQKVAVRHYLKNEYHREGRFKSGKSQSNKNYLDALIGLDCGDRIAEFTADYTPKIPIERIKVSSKAEIDIKRKIGAKPFESVENKLSLIKATASPSETVNIQLHWRDGVHLTTDIKVKALTQQTNSSFWKTLLKSKTKVETPNHYQTSDDEPLRFDYEINFIQPKFYYSQLESAYWHESDQEKRQKIYFSGYVYHKQYLAKCVQDYLNQLPEEEVFEFVELTRRSFKVGSFLDTLQSNGLQKDNSILQSDEIIQLIETAIAGHKNAVEVLSLIISRIQSNDTMVSLPKQRSNLITRKETVGKEDKRISLNTEIEKLLDQKGKDPLKYSDEELELISSYSGYGGSKLSEVNKGLLYEYYTPDEIIRYMWGFAIKHGYQKGAVLEPSCGIGKFLKYVPKGSRVEAFETNPYSAQIAQILYPNAKINNQSFEQLFFNGNIYLKGGFRTEPFDLVIGNPPYGSFSGKYAGMGEKRRTKAFTYDQYFLTRGLDLLAPSGLLIFIIPQSFLDNGINYNPLKESILKKAKLLEARRLPHGIFEHTDIGTDIVVFKKEIDKREIEKMDDNPADLKSETNE